MSVLVSVELSPVVGAGRLWLLARWQSDRPAVPGEIETVGSGPPRRRTS
jgi:hypothetical protein